MRETPMQSLRTRRPDTTPVDLPLYETVAADVQSLIDRGTFRPGDRVPSVRALSRELAISVTTVLGAYRLLESRGVIESRPQSGYYVRTRMERRLPEPHPAPHQHAEPEDVTVDKLVVRLMQNAHRKDLVPLGAAIPAPDLLPTARLNRALVAVARRLGDRTNNYDFPPGCEALRTQIARRALEGGAALAPDDIITTCGCLEAVHLALRATCEPGDTVAVESPTYYCTLQALEALGLKALEIPMHPRDGMSLEALQCALDQHPVKAVLSVATFNNPIGCCMPDDRRRALVSMLADRGIPLIEDDIYAPIHFGPTRPRTLKSFDRKGLVLWCSSFSKDIAPGYRVGWIAPGRFRDRVIRLKMVTNHATPLLPQLAIAEFMAVGGYEHHLRRIRRSYEQRVAATIDAVERYFPDGTRVSRPQGGWVIWVEMPRRADSVKVYETAVASGISVAPGPIFSARGHYRNFIRLNGAWEIERVDRSLLALGRIVSEASRR